MDNKGLRLEVTKTYKTTYDFDDGEKPEDVWIVEGKRLDNGGRFWVDLAWWNDKWTPFNWYLDGDHSDYALFEQYAFNIKIEE